MILVLPYAETWRKLLATQKISPDSLTLALAHKLGPDGLGGAEERLVAAGPGWRVLDLVCTRGPRDRPFEERHAAPSVSLVIAGTFVYRGDRGALLMAPGAMLLGSAGRPYECSHGHGAGDRCLSFRFDDDCFARLAEDVGSRRPTFERDTLPPLRVLAALAARARSVLENAPADAQALFEEISLELGRAALKTANEVRTDTPSRVNDRDFARIGRTLREVESDLEQPRTLAAMAAAAGMSRYHFLRTFRRMTGATPHQWLLRARLREAARRLAGSRDPITEIALDAGFGDLSNFIRTFRAEFGCSPRRFRRGT